MKRTLSLSIVLVVWAAGLVGGAEAVDGRPNAALRYWMAFAQMENPDARSEVAKRLNDVSDGRAPWDDGLAAVVDANRTALETLHRGSRLPFCDWGYEHELLEQAPIANVPRARALARLNVLHGMRLASQGKTEEAVTVWLAGVRFSRHAAADGPLMSALFASGALKAHLTALARAVRDGKVDAARRGEIGREVAALPADGFDWSVGARHESEGVSAILRQLESAGDPLAALRARDQAMARSIEGDLGTSDRATVRAAFERARRLNDELRSAYIAAFQGPCDASPQAVREIDARATKDPILHRMSPILARADERRCELVKARQELLALLK